MITDTERLDWLEKTCQTVYKFEEQEFVPATDGTDRRRIQVVFKGWTIDGQVFFKSPREAIDHGIAMKW